MKRRTLTTALTAALTGTAAAGIAGPASAEGSPAASGTSPAGAAPTGVSPTAEDRPPQNLLDGLGFYPRVIRLAHNGEADDRLLASVVTFGGADNSEGSGAILESTDGGAMFTQVGSVSDEATTGGEGLCCATLYELPRAIGDLPEGTLLWSSSVGADLGGADGRRMTIRVWSSTDLGRTWERIAITHSATNGGGLWEPEFAVADDGTLVIFFCDETDGVNHSQKIVLQTSADGLTWTDPVPVIELEDPTSRPGMPNVRRLADGRWAMSYEVCGGSAGDLCRSFVRTADDPRDWGAVTARDTAIVATDGTEPRHTPTLTLDEDDSVILGSQMHYTTDGAISAQNGKVALRTKNATLTGDISWVSEPVPAPVADPDDSPCPNYSPTFVRTDSGHLLEITTAPDETGTCRAQYGSLG
ncbi:exo-alpha-sialidase [Brachybacterium endophyticum]|uniref:Exo-alpha-sialidase n=1 Tax=Brachybacterium endophyticum TaxID=2182385 RepID=A0A2U2RMK6_9MICO|nr:sialidase family protein [Brachybacterium endophyticum]PWH07109.1 exo-alpha-sialidase [Brachybacterium endophyticum]